MNKYLVICLIITLVLSIGFSAYLVLVKFPELRKEAVFENIMNRKSVRHFIKGKTVSDTDMEKILKAGMAAPTARNSQPWEFIVVKDRKILDNLAEKSPFGKMLFDASCAIIVAGNLNKIEGANEFWQQDTSAATENILLAVEALNLGAVWIGGYPKEERAKMISETLLLPENVIPLNIIAIGYPTGEDKPKDKWKPSNIHYDKW